MTKRPKKSREAVPEGVPPRGNRELVFEGRWPSATREHLLPALMVATRAAVKSPGSFRLTPAASLEFEDPIAEHWFFADDRSNALPDHLAYEGEVIARPSPLGLHLEVWLYPDSSATSLNFAKALKEQLEEEGFQPTSREGGVHLVPDPQVRRVFTALPGPRGSFLDGTYDRLQDETGLRRPDVGRALDWLRAMKYVESGPGNRGNRLTGDGEKLRQNTQLGA